MNDKTMRIVDVGAPVDGKKTSPIGTETAEDEALIPPDTATGDPVCWFNDQEFGQDEMVYSGNDILRCDGGIWVRAGRRQ